MLFRNHILKRIRSGEVTMAFRNWKRPSVKAGGTIISPVGLLAIHSVEMIDVVDILPSDAVAAGHADIGGLLAELSERDGTTYRVVFSWAGEDPRILLRQQIPDEAELDQIRMKLDRMDKRSKSGPWTRHALALIRDHPARRAGDLADLMGLEKQDFKIRVRRLKAMGLTESLEVGYRLSPRGRHVVANA